MASDGGQVPHHDSSDGRVRPGGERALIVSTSPVTRIVIARTVEGVYLRPDAVTPEAAVRALRTSKPRIVIIEASASNDSLKPLMSELALRRREKALPRVVLIADATTHRDMPPLEGLFDAVVAKPLTPDGLQPVLERLSR